MNYKIIAVCIILFSQSAYASKVCYGKPDLYKENRFSHCNKGDIITVNAIPTSNPIYPDKTKNGAMFINEVSHNCSFEHEIIKIATTDFKSVTSGTLPLSIFNCVYIGSERSPHFLNNPSIV